MESIGIRGIRAYGRHGADPGERDYAQPFDIDVELACDLARARHSDDLRDTVDYALVHGRIREIVERSSFALLERLGEEIIGALLGLEGVRAVELRIAKPGLFAGATPWVCLRSPRPAC